MRRIELQKSFFEKEIFFGVQAQVNWYFGKSEKLALGRRKLIICLAPTG
jgi:hypothetical protein